MSGVIRHVAIVELRADCSSDERDALVDRIRALGASVPDVLAMTAGVARDGDGALLNRVCLVSDHPSRDALRDYLAHPDHQAVAAEVGRLRESVAGADFEL